MTQKLWREPFQIAMAKRRNRHAVKRYHIVTFVSIGLVCAVLVATLSLVLLSRTSTFAHGVNITSRSAHASTIRDLNQMREVGSTAVIVDGQGHTQAVDANPYGVAIAPPTTPAGAPGSLRAGDIVVTNIGGEDHGTTLVRFPGRMGPGRLFNTLPMGTTGPADEAFNTLNGLDWVANVSANDIQIFKTDGTVAATVKSALFNKPWGQAFNGGLPNKQDGSVASFFTSNVADATIDRIDVIPGANNTTTFRVFQIGQLTRMGDETKIGMLWVPSIRAGDTLLKDVLLTLDPATNRIAAFPNSTTLKTTATRSTSPGMTLFQGKPLNMPGGLSMNPLNGDVLVVNLNDNNLVEVNLAHKRTIGIRQIDNVPVDAQTGNGSALFGVAATTDQRGNLVVYFTDDNTNTLNVLTAS